MQNGEIIKIITKNNKNNKQSTIENKNKLLAIVYIAYVKHLLFAAHNKKLRCLLPVSSACTLWCGSLLHVVLDHTDINTI